LPNIIYRLNLIRRSSEANGIWALQTLSQPNWSVCVVAIINDTTSALMALSKRFAKTADNVAKASTSDMAGQQMVATTTERKPDALPPAQFQDLSTTMPDGKSEIDLGEEMVRLHTTETYYMANLRVVATKDELQGTVLDIIA